MNNKLLVLGAVVLVMVVAGFLSPFSARGSVSPGDDATAIALLPDTIGGRAISRRWSNPQDGWTIEEGALYSPSTASGGNPILLDFYRNTRIPHNGAGCYLRQGEILRSEALHEARTRSGTAVFDVAIMQTEDHIRLAAATECSAGACTEARLFGMAAWRERNFKSLFDSTRNSIVPVSIVIQQKYSDSGGVTGAADAEANVLKEFQAVVAELDLAPAQRLAMTLDAPSPR